MINLIDTNVCICLRHVYYSRKNNKHGFAIVKIDTVLYVFSHTFFYYKKNKKYGFVIGQNYTDLYVFARDLHRFLFPGRTKIWAKQNRHMYLFEVFTCFLFQEEQKLQYWCLFFILSFYILYNPPAHQSPIWHVYTPPCPAPCPAPSAPLAKF